MRDGTMDPDVRRALEQAFPGRDARYFDPIFVGSTPASADEGAAAILRGSRDDDFVALLGLARWPHPIRWGLKRSVERARLHVRYHRDQASRSYGLD